MLFRNKTTRKRCRYSLYPTDLSRNNANKNTIFFLYQGRRVSLEEDGGVGSDDTDVSDASDANDMDASEAND